MDEIQHPLLGRLTFDEDDESWVTTAKHDGTEYTVRLAIEEVPTDDELAGAAEIIANLDVETWVAAATEDLLEIYNGSWRDEDPQLDAEEFASRLVIEEVAIYSDFNLEVTFRADGLFADHRICVSVDEDGDVVDVDL